MSTFSITVSAGSAEELLSELLTVVNAMSAGAGLSLSAPAEANEAPATKEEPATDTSAPTGRRGARNKAADKAPEAEAEESAPKSRRSRGAAKAEDPVNDNEEQAALRAQLIVDLQDLADVEEAHSDVADALKRVGAKSVKEVASASLGDFNEDIQKLIAQHFE